MSNTPRKNDPPKASPQINQTFPPFNCPPPFPNPYIYSYPPVPPPSYFPVPPPFIPNAGSNHPYYYPPGNVPLPYHSSHPNSSLNLPYAGGKFSNYGSTSISDDFDLKKFFPHAEKKPSVVSQVKIWEVSRQFKSYYRILMKLESELQLLSDENTSINENKLREIASMQEELIACKNSLSKDPLFLICLKYKLKKRIKKRSYRKKQRKNKRRIHVSEVASEHMQHLEQQASHVKQDEKLKQEADNILSSVKEKKTDARYQIQLLQNLLKLHSARVHQLTVETNFTPDASVTGFEKVLERLISLWESKMQEYTKEENGLKLVVNQLAVNAEDEDVKELQNIFDEWLELIFGTSDLHSDVCYSSFEQLIAIRQGWDKFAVDEKDPRGSKIPSGWVVPKYNQNPEWQKFLNQVRNSKVCILQTESKPEISNSETSDVSKTSKDESLSQKWFKTKKGQVTSSITNEEKNDEKCDKVLDVSTPTEKSEQNEIMDIDVPTQSQQSDTQKGADEDDVSLVDDIINDGVNLSTDVDISETDRSLKSEPSAPNTRSTKSNIEKKLWTKQKPKREEVEQKRLEKEKL